MTISATLGLGKNCPHNCIFKTKEHVHLKKAKIVPTIVYLKQKNMFT